MKPQLADSLTTWRLAAELDGVLAGAVVRKVLAAGPAAMVVELSVKSQPASLVVNWAQGTARVHLADEVETSREEPSFVTAARRALTGAVVEDVRQLALRPRRSAVGLANLENFGAEERGRLIIEATGREPNCLLVRGDAIGIVASPKPATENVYRALAPGEPYAPPPGQDRPDPRTATVEELRAILAAGEADVPDALRRGLQGTSRLLLDEALRRVRGDRAEDWRAALDEVLAEAQGEAWLWRDEDGRPTLAYPLPVHLADPGEWEKIDGLSAGLEEIGGRIEDGRDRERLTGQVGKQLRHDMARKNKVLTEREREF